jgi:uncharacterized ubiquitin-like protein YukD
MLKANYILSKLYLKQEDYQTAKNQFQILEKLSIESGDKEFIKISKKNLKLLKKMK